MYQVHYQVHYRDSSGRTRPGITGTQEECEARARSYVGAEGVRTEEVDRVSYRGPRIDRGPNLSLAPGLVAWVAPAVVHYARR